MEDMGKTVIAQYMSAQEQAYYHEALDALETGRKSLTWLMHSAWALAAMTFVSVLTLSVASAPSVSSQYATSTATTTLPAFSTAANLPDAENIYQIVNGLRAADGLPTLTRNVALTQLASSRAADMESHQYFAHKGTDGTFFDAHLADYNYHAAYALENLDLTDSTSANTVVKDWYTSTKGHKECMLNAHTTDVGLAVAEITTKGSAPSYIIVAVQAQSATTTVASK